MPTVTLNDKEVEFIRACFLVAFDVDGPSAEGSEVLNKTEVIELLNKLGLKDIYWNLVYGSSN